MIAVSTVGAWRTVFGATNQNILYKCDSRSHKNQVLETEQTDRKTALITAQQKNRRSSEPESTVHHLLDSPPGPAGNTLSLSESLR